MMTTTIEINKVEEFSELLDSFTEEQKMTLSSLALDSLYSAIEEGRCNVHLPDIVAFHFFNDRFWNDLSIEEIKSFINQK